MTEERLKEIKDSIDFQLDIAKINKLDGVINCLIEEQELYDEVINLKEENERLKKELNKHIKEGIEKDIIIDKAKAKLRSMFDNGNYIFRLKTNGQDCVKTPFGMFESDSMENDLKEFDKVVREYYELDKKEGDNNV